MRASKSRSGQFAGADTSVRMRTWEDKTVLVEAVHPNISSDASVEQVARRGEVGTTVELHAGCSSLLKIFTQPPRTTKLPG